MTPATTTRAALARIGDAQRSLHDMLRDVDPVRLRARPPSGEWSPLEHVRHLVFAEQHHFAPHLERGFRWSSAGVPPPNRTGERRLSPTGSHPATTLDDVFEGWAKIHAVVRARCMERPATSIGHWPET
jgi:hypothetical protein